MAKRRFEKSEFAKFGDPHSPEGGVYLIRDMAGIGTE
jgi:hypothetical protein